jgi:hypothetical protein
MAEGFTPVPPGAPDKLRVGMSQALLRWVASNAETWTKGRNLGGGDLILITIFARSVRTYEAIVRCLGERGFGEQGLMLNRSLFEDMIDAHWVSLNRELATKRLEQHDLYSRLLRADTQRKFPSWFDGRKPPRIKVTNEERKALQGLYGKSGSGSWTGAGSLDERVASVKSCWADDGQELLFWTAWVHKMTNEVIHPTAFSLGRLGTPKVTDQGDFEWHFGSTAQWLPQSLHAAVWTLGQIVSLVIDQYHPSSREQFDEQFRQTMMAFPKAAHWEATGRLEDPPSS